MGENSEIFNIFQSLYGGNFIGPGNRIDEEYIRQNPPVSLLDAAAMEHDQDMDYDYFRFTDSDQKLIDRVEQISGFPARTIESYFKVKKYIAPKKQKKNPDDAGPSGSGPSA